MSDYLKNKKINLGFIGCGDIAHFHADVLKELDMNIIAVSGRKFSPNIAPFSKKYGIRNQYSDWQLMVNNEDIDALWVMASWDQMDQMLIPLIETGLPLFLEKPVALSSAKIFEAIEVHKKSKQFIQVGYNRRFYPFMGEIKSIIETGELLSVLVEIPESIDLANLELTQNLWLINSSHVIDLLIYLAGRLTIKYKNNKSRNNSKIISSYNAILETEKGLPVHLSAEWNTANNFGITFFVDNKSIVLKPLEIAIICEGFNIINPTKKNPLRQYQPKKIEKYFCDEKFKPGFYEQAEYFHKQLKTKIFENKHSDLKGCLVTTKLIEDLTETNNA
jgi:predicted dehydrogenase